MKPIVRRRPAAPPPATLGIGGRVIAALENGEVADFDAWLGVGAAVGCTAGWDADSTLDASFIVGLCVNTAKGQRRFPRGVRIKGARIVGNINLASAVIDVLVLLERCRIEGGVSLRDATTKLVNLAGSRIAGNLDGDRLRSAGGVYLRNHFTCDGVVRLSAAVLDGDLDCTDGSIRGAIVGDALLALRCDRIRVTGSIFFTNFEATGEVRLLDAAVGANVVLKGASLSHPAHLALLADNARIAGSLVLRSWKAVPDGQISLRNATANVLELGRPDETWPENGTVRAQGFRYSALETEGTVNLALCKRWLDQLALTPFSPQPYEKCAQVLREMGLTSDAKEIAIRRRRIQRALPGVSGFRRFGERALDRLIGYGYRPGRSVGMLALLALIGAGVFMQAKSNDAMVPSDSGVYTSEAYRNNHDWLPPGYPPFNSVVYSLDVLLPIIDFQQDSKWRPSAGKSVRHVFGGAAYNVEIGWIAMYYMWIQIALGWILSTLLVASVTGLIRKE